MKYVKKINLAKKWDSFLASCWITIFSMSWPKFSFSCHEKWSIIIINTVLIKGYTKRTTGQGAIVQRDDWVKGWSVILVRLFIKVTTNWSGGHQKCLNLIQGWLNIIFCPKSRTLVYLLLPQEMFLIIYSSYILDLLLVQVQPHISQLLVILK